MMNYQNMTNPNLPNPNLMNSYLSYSSITNNNRTPQEDEEEDADDKLDISLDDIYNTNEVQNMKELIKCPICLNVLMSPVQCNKCNNCFCKLCINTYEDSKIKCPFRCEYPIYQENKFVKNVLSILKFKCKNGCSEIIKYEDLENADIWNFVECDYCYVGSESNVFGSVVNSMAAGGVTQKVKKGGFNLHLQQH